MAQHDPVPYSSFASACHATLKILHHQLRCACCLISQDHSKPGHLIAREGGMDLCTTDMECAWLNALCSHAGTSDGTPLIMDQPALRDILKQSYPDAASSVKTCIVMPVVTPEGSTVATFCALDARRSPEDFTDETSLLVLISHLLGVLYASEQQAQRATCAEHEVKRTAERLQARIDELSCQYQLDLLGIMENLPIADLLQQATEIIPRAWHSPGKVKVQILFDGETYSSSEFELTTWCQNEPLRQGRNSVGAIRVCYEGDSPNDNTLFDEESRLLSSMALRLMAIIRRKRTELALKKEHWRLQSAIEGTNVGTWEWNIQTGETRFNHRWAEIVGYTLEELEPVSIETWLGLAHPDDLKASEHLLKDHLNGKRPFYDVDCRMRHKDGHWIWVHDRGKVFEWDDAGKPLVMYGTHQDITDRKETEAALREAQARFEMLSKHDGLTGLLNQRGWEEALQQEQLRAQRYEHTTGILICDLDGLKIVNDLQGHQAGDLWIKRASHCIRKAVRDVDLVARIGGDEFAVMALECNQDRLNSLLERLSETLAEEGIGASWGGILAAPGHNFAHAIREADKQMYVMKEAHHRTQSLRTRHVDG